MRGLASISALWLIVVSGCSDGTIQIPPVVMCPVKGHVLLANGKPLTAGRILFDGPEETPPEAIIQPDGSFEMKGGVLSGKHIAFIAPIVQGRRKLSIPVPRQYLSPGTSSLVAEVHEGDNNLEFRLK